MKLWPSFLFFVFLTSSAGAENLQILTSEIPPMVFTKDNKLTGYCIDLVQEIQRRIGNQTEIQVVPWSRAYHTGKTKGDVMLICPKRTPDRENLFKWVGPVHESTTNFYKKKNAQIQIKSLEDAMKASSVLITRNFYSYDDLLKKGFKNLETTETPQLAMRMLLGGRAPLMVLEKLQAAVLLKEINAAPDAIEEAYTLSPSVSYLSFSKGMSDATVKTWQDALDKMKKDGTYSRIYKKWWANSND